MEFINQFSFSVEYHPGTSPEMTVPDCFSRCFNAQNPILTRISSDIIRPYWVKASVTHAELIKEQENDPTLNNKFDNKKWKVLRHHGYQPEMKDGVIFAKKKNKKSRICIPIHLEEKLLEFYHLPAHAGQRKMYAELSKSVIFPNMADKCLKFISKCKDCVAVKRRKKAKTTYIKTTTPPHPWQHLQKDLIGPMPQTLNGSKYILVVVDCLTRWTETQALPSKSEKDTTEALMKILFRRGPPLNITSDNGREFNNETIKKCLEDFGVRLHHGAPLKPTTQGIVERTNSKIKRNLQLMQPNYEEWDEYLQPITLAINLEVHDSIKTSPFQALHGWVLNLPSFVEKDRTQVVNFDGKRWAEELSRKMQYIISDMYIMEETKKLDGKSEGAPQLKPGQLVLVYFPLPAASATSGKYSAKLFRNWKGTFVVKKAIDRDTYIVYNKDQSRKELICHRSRLRPIGEENIKEDLNDVDKLEDGQPNNDTSNVPSDHIMEEIVESKKPIGDIPRRSKRNKIRVDYRET